MIKTGQFLYSTLTATALACASFPATAQLKYPVPPTSDASDVLFGQRYQDPYRPLETLRDKAVEKWFKAEADLTDAKLAQIHGRDALIKEWTELDKRTPPRYRDVIVESGHVYYRKTLGGENVGKLYFRETWDGPEQLLFDPASYQKVPDAVVSLFKPSPDGKYVALGLSTKGAEWTDLRILRVADKTLLEDSMYPAGWFGVNWLPDSSALLYNGGNTTDLKSNEIELNRQIRIHKIGTPTSADRDLLSSASTPELTIAAKEIPVGEVPESAPDRLIAGIYTVQPEMRIYTAPITELGKPHIAWKSVAQPSDNLVRGYAIQGRYIYAITHENAPHYRLVRTLIDQPDWKNAETVVPEDKDSIEGLAQSRDFILLSYTNGITGKLVRYSLVTGKSETIALPVQGTVEASCPDAHSNRCLVNVSSWLKPLVVLEVDGDGAPVVRESQFNGTASYPELADLVADEVEVPAADGVLVPLSLIHRKDIRLDGSTPCILEGYGAYGISYTPYFNPMFSLASHGVVIAFAHVRGGGEKGEAWYKAGYKTTKANTWNDFIATAEYLVSKGYTSSQHLTGRGTSAGGVLISRAITERPDLFAAAVVNVGVANALRAEFTPNGPVNTPEFGTVKDPVEAKALYEMDGLQHVQPGVRYPAVLGVGGWNDPRVAPWQPGKFIAAVQQATTSGRPALLLINYDNGHFTEEKSVTFRNFASQYAFALWQAGDQEFQPVEPAKKSSKPIK
jgi:prolyl oligopeptidase